jgi:Tol biopolymer transport system component
MEPTAPEQDRLDSWKQIAAYLKKSERTVRRWQENESLPVHKHPHQQRGSVWAYRRELDDWLAARVIRPEPALVTVAGAKRPYAWPMAVASISLLCILLVRRASEPRQMPDPIPLTTLPGQEYGASFSPDGTRFVFHWTPSDSLRWGLYVKRMDGDRVTPLAVSIDTPPSYNYSPAWSPDGRTIAFLRRTPEQETWLVLIDTNGGSERALVRISGASMLYFGNHQHVSWSHDNKWLFVPMALNDEGRGIYRISAITGEAVPIATGFAGYAPAVSPDGRYLVALRIEGMPLSFQEVLLYTLDAASSVQGSPVSLYRGYSVSSGIAWMSDSKTLLFCNAETSLFGPFDSRLYRLPALAGARLTAIGGTGCNTVSVSSQGLVAFGNSSHTRSKMLHTGLRSAEPVREFAASSRYDSYPTFSPDGSFVAFYSNRSGRPGIWVAKPDGTDLRRIMEHSLLRSGPAWSPDGRRLLYVLGHSLVISSINGTEAPMTIGAGDAVPQHPVWSADGKALHYSVGRQLWRVRIEGTGRRTLGDSGPILSLVASPDGRGLYYARLGRKFTLCRRSVDGTAEQIIEQGLPVASIAVTRKFLYFIRGDMNLYALPLAGGPAEKIGTIPKLEGTGIGSWETRFAISPDDSAIIWTFTEFGEVDLEMLRSCVDDSASRLRGRLA